MKKLCSIWNPLFFMSAYDQNDIRDLDNAQKNWDNHDFIWFIPGFKEKIEWIDEPVILSFKLPIKHLVIHGVFPNVIQVIRIDEDSNIYAPSLYHPEIPTLLPEGWAKVPKNLFLKWCNSKPIFQNMEELNSEIKFPFPVFPITSNERLDYRERTFKLCPPMFDLKQISKKDFILDFQDNKVILNQIYNWSAPFNNLLPYRGWSELLWQHTSMVNCLEENQDNCKRKINSFLSKHSWSGEDFYEKLWLLPKLRNSIKDTLFNVEGKFDLSCETLPKLLNAEEYKGIFRKKVDSTIILGWYGYFWWEIEKTMRKSNILSCKRCGNVIIGKRSDKMFCSRKENEQCYKERRAEDKSREREKGM